MFEIVETQIIFATGYLNMRSQARIIFGDELADRVGGKFQTSYCPFLLDLSCISISFWGEVIPDLN